MNNGFNFRDIKKFKKQLEKLEENKDAFIESCTKEIAARLLAKVKKLTPVYEKPKIKEATVEVKGVSGESKSFLDADTARYQQYWAGYVGGTLRRGWVIGDIIKENGVYRIDVTNSVEYARYVEYGHRQKKGRYVPALGKALSKSWVIGKFMLTISEQEIESITPKLLESKIKAFLKEHIK